MTGNETKNLCEALKYDKPFGPASCQETRVREAQALGDGISVRLDCEIGLGMLLASWSLPVGFFRNH